MSDKQRNRKRFLKPTMTENVKPLQDTNPLTLCIASSSNRAPHGKIKYLCPDDVPSHLKAYSCGYCAFWHGSTPHDFAWRMKRKGN